jgi:hypothetical protein
MGDEQQYVEFEIAEEFLGGVEDFDESVLLKVVAFHGDFEELEAPVAAGMGAGLGRGWSR